MGVRRVATGVGQALGQGILGIIVLGCIAISLFFAYEFGSGKAATAQFAVAYGLASAGLDLLKAVLPIIAAAAYTKTRAGLAWAAFVFLTCMSLWCAMGTTAGQLAEKTATQFAAKSASDEKADKLTRLRADRAALGTVTRATPEMVAAQQAAVDAIAQQVKVEAANGGCKGKCGDRQRDEREARAALVKVQADAATTDKADKIDSDIASAEEIKVDVLTAEKDVDPQATSIAKAFNISIEKAALIGHIIFAIGIEIGSGLGLWLVFGHGGHAPARAPVPHTTELSPKPNSANEDERQNADRKRFFATCVYHGIGRVPAGLMHGAYLVWIKSNGTAPPMGVQAFGTRSPWMGKKRIGGIVHYLNCGVAPGLLPTPQPALRIVTN